MAQPLAVGLHVLNRGEVTPDQSVAVVGVGGIGAMVVGGAAARGVSDLIAVDVDEIRLETAASIGAKVCLNARREDVPAAIRGATGGEGADVIIECSGRPESPGTALDAVRRGGRLVIVGLQKEPVALDLWQLVMQEVEMTTAMAHVCGSDLPEAIEILAGTELAHHVLDRVIPLEEVVGQGLVPLVERQAKGKIVVDTTGNAG
jgi:(R,R)-butanediol dehydrogenase/meso-butanediol dehydrogenase/diacetyl reductase